MHILGEIGDYDCHSDGVLANSAALENESLNIQASSLLPETSQVARYVILGDEVFPFMVNLLRPNQERTTS